MQQIDLLKGLNADLRARTETLPRQFNQIHSASPPRDPLGFAFFEGEYEKLRWRAQREWTENLNAQGGLGGTARGHTGPQGHASAQSHESGPGHSGTQAHPVNVVHQGNSPHEPAIQGHGKGRAN